MISLGILGTIIAALDIYAIWCILHETWSGGKKVLWICIILFFQVVGMILYFAFFRENGGRDDSILPPRK